MLRRVMGRHDRELDVTLATIRRAGEEILRRYASFERIEDAPADISTAADRASQELILEALHEAFPGDGLCAEEASARFETEAAGAERFWVVDPIDGTRGFARKNGEFSVMIALVVDGDAVLGAVHEPAAERLTWAVAGEGCRVVRSGAGGSGEGERCRVSATEGRPRVLAMSRSQGEEGERQLLGALGAERAIQTYSAGIKLAQVARGEADLYLGDYLTLRDWDVAAGHVLVTEAGGRVTSVDGDPVRYDGSGRSLRGRGIVASNGGVHRAALEAIAAGRVTW
ncbi:MAG TPA: inositol monophosphatase family protein [Thermoanaerobaculia bacterium]|nr:inositol monophosphatase family protein [Thermoanaerobaculia bacterium]